VESRRALARQGVVKSGDKMGGQDQQE